MKQCPYCSEDIQDTAKKCKHCGEWLDVSAKPQDNQMKKLIGECCPDGNCLGHIRSNGLCSVCGLPVSHTMAEREEEKSMDLETTATSDRRIVCPHCHVGGQVYTENVTRKKGISGGKATAALLTGGVSILATGLSRKQEETKATCHNCGAVWYF